MIKANELRIGNWVLNIYDKPLQISLVDDTVNWAKPIPLTLEILEKAGFERHKDNQTYFLKINSFLILNIDKEDSSFALYDSEDNYSAGNYPAFNFCVKHLHQLQNLYFALTGEELNIQI